MSPSVKQNGKTVSRRVVPFSDLPVWEKVIGYLIGCYGFSLVLYIFYESVVIRENPSPHTVSALGIMALTFSVAGFLFNVLARRMFSYSSSKK